MKRPHVLLVPVLLLSAAGCARHEDPAEEAPPRDVAPWALEALTPGEVSPVYLAEWQKAENRDRCSLLAPAAVSPAAAEARAATFAGGWGVAYDLPDLRSAFGVAGTGVDLTGTIYDDWPHHRQWPDGSRVGYGPEGGTGPDQLAYLTIAGEECLYNVWSRIGVEHLEQLIEQLRRVAL